MKDKAISKLREELKTAKQKSVAKPVIEHLIRRIGEDEGLAEDVMKKGKSWEQCFSYVYNKAKKEAVKNVAVIADDAVYEWAEDYYRGLDKDVEKVAGKAAEKPSGKAKAAKPKDSTGDTQKAAEEATAEPEEGKKDEDDKEPEILAKPKARKKPKKTQKEKDEESGQMSIFDMIGGFGG
jgi:hypothetical protein